MADPYRAYVPSSSHDRAVPQGHYPGYVPLEESYYASKMAALRGVSTIPRVDVPLQSRAYGLDGPAGVSRTNLAGLGALPAGPIPWGASPLEDPVLVRGSSSLGKSASIPEVERPISLPIVDLPSEDESNILFVDDLPTDCTRREVAHLFRPFVGFKDLRLVHKEPRRVCPLLLFPNASYFFFTLNSLNTSSTRGNPTHQSSRSGSQGSHSDLRRPMMMGNALALADYHPLHTPPLQQCIIGSGSL
ncbi:hypothetical protein ACQ4PT_013389 [Festuca glaucescens]